MKVVTWQDGKLSDGIISKDLKYVDLGGIHIPINEENPPTRTEAGVIPSFSLKNGKICAEAPGDKHILGLFASTTSLEERAGEFYPHSRDISFFGLLWHFHAMNGSARKFKDGNHTLVYKHGAIQNN